jgi:hypothetical protein
MEYAAERRQVLQSLRKAAKIERERLKQTNPLHQFMHEHAKDINISQELPTGDASELPEGDEDDPFLVRSLCF